MDLEPGGEVVAVVESVVAVAVGGVAGSAVMVTVVVGVGVVVGDMVVVENQEGEERMRPAVIAAQSVVNPVDMGQTSRTSSRPRSRRAASRPGTWSRLGTWSWARASTWSWSESRPWSWSSPWLWPWSWSIVERTW